MKTNQEIPNIPKLFKKSTRTYLEKQNGLKEAWDNAPNMEMLYEILRLVDLDDNVYPVNKMIELADGFCREWFRNSNELAFFDFLADLKRAFKGNDGQTMLRLGIEIEELFLKHKKKRKYGILDSWNACWRCYSAANGDPQDAWFRLVSLFFSLNPNHRQIPMSEIIATIGNPFKD